MDAFKPVIVAIGKMIGELRAEEQEDIAHRDPCESKEQKVNILKGDLKYKLGLAEGLIEQLESVKQFDKDTEVIGAVINEAEEGTSEAMANRNVETADFRQALKDDTDAAEMIVGAIEALTTFYVNNKLPLNRLGLKEPEYRQDPEVDPVTGNIDQSPGGASSVSKGTIGIPKMLKQVLENEIAEATKEKTEAAAEFAVQRKTAWASLDALSDMKVDQ